MPSTPRWAARAASGFRCCTSRCWWSAGSRWRGWRCAASPEAYRGVMTPRGTDWGLALVVALLFASGMASLFAASPGEGWVFVVHDVLAFVLAGLLVVKMRRGWGGPFWPRARGRPPEPRGVAAAAGAGARGAGRGGGGGGG